MKIGTKSNAIDDLGKFDGSKMTIKVGGKQIYPQKRYAIIRVDGVCPIYNDKDFNRKSKNFCYRFNCSNCLYGDTKEQMVRKVAQVIFKAKLERYRQVWKCECSEMEKRDRYKDSLTLAKEIVEFLGVE